MCLIVLYLPSLPRSPSLLFIASSNGDATRYNWKGAKNHVMVLMQQSSGLWGPKRLLLQSVTSRLVHDSQAGRQGWSRPAPSPPPPSSSLLQWRENRTAGDGMVGKGPGSREENREGGVKPGDYATVAVCYGCVKSYTAANNRCPPPLYPENEGSFDKVCKGSCNDFSYPVCHKKKTL